VLDGKTPKKAEIKINKKNKWFEVIKG